MAWVMRWSRAGATDRYVVDARGVLADVMAAASDRPILHYEQVLHWLRSFAMWPVREGRPRTSNGVGWKRAVAAAVSPIASLLGKSIYSNHMVADMSPGLIKPLLYSTNTLSMARNVFGKCSLSCSGRMTQTTPARRAHPLAHLHRRHAAWQVVRAPGLPANFFEMIARDERGERRRPRSTGAHCAPRSGYCASRAACRVTGEISAFLQRHHRDLEPFRRADWASATPDALLAHYAHLRQIHSETQWFVSSVRSTWRFATRCWAASAALCTRGDAW